MEKGELPLGISDPDASILNYAKILTATPWKVENSHIDDLRNNGFSDKGILQINMVVDYFNYVNRLASGLGVELEDYWDINRN